MIKYCYYQRKENKCNFCFQWFKSESTLKNSIHLCGICIEKALNTTCYKVPSPDGSTWYQLFLLKNNLQIDTKEVVEEQCEKNSLLEDIDMYRNEEINKIKEKWVQVSEKVKEKTSFDSSEANKLTKYFQESLQKLKEIERQLLKKLEREGEVKQESFPLKLNSNKLNIELPNPDKKKRIRTETDESPMKNYSSFLMKDSKKSDGLTFKREVMKKKMGNLKKTGLNLQENIFTKKFDDKSKLNESSYSRTSSKDKKSVWKNSSMSNSNVDVNEKKIKDLEAIKQDALKNKIYQYLEKQTNVSPALYLVMTFRIYDALKNTATMNKCIEIISYNISDIEIKCYLEMLEWQGIQILKLVKVGLTDDQFKYLIEFLQNKKVDTIVVSSNKLTERSCQQLDEKVLATVKNVYMSKNKIQKGKIRDSIKNLQEKYMIYI